jgi:hypothetical protein
LCTVIERRLECHVQSIPQARHELARALDNVGVGKDRTYNDILVVATEMMTNAVRACKNYLGMRIQIHHTWLQIDVTDDNPNPAVQLHPAPDETHGRGIKIIAALSERWGQTPWNGSTKTIWSQLTLPLDRPLTIYCRY